MMRQSRGILAKGGGRFAAAAVAASVRVSEEWSDTTRGPSSLFQQQHTATTMTDQQRVVAGQPIIPTRPHDLYSYNRRPHDVHNGRLSGEATTLVHPSAKRAASRHVVHEDDLLPNTQSDRLYNTLAKYGTPQPPPLSPTSTSTHHDKNALFSQFVLIRRCYPSASHINTFPSYMESTRLAAGGMLVGQPALERGPAATPHFTPPHTSFDMYMRTDVTQHLYALLATMHRSISTTTTTTIPTTVMYTYTLLHDLYTSLLAGDASSSEGRTSRRDNNPTTSGLSREEGLSCAISATLELSRVLHTAVRSGGNRGGSFWGKLHPCTHHVPSASVVDSSSSSSLTLMGHVMTLDTYITSTSPPRPSSAISVSLQPPQALTFSAPSTVGVVVMTDVEFTFFIVDSMTGVMIRPPVQMLYEKGALTKQFGNSSLFHNNVDYKAFIQSFWVETLSSSLEFQMASRWMYRMDPQAWNVLRQLSEDGSLSTAWEVLSSTPSSSSPPPYYTTNSSSSSTQHPPTTDDVCVDGSSIHGGERRQPRPTLNIVSERRLHQREVQTQRNRDREVEQQLLHESLFTASTTQPSLFTTGDGDTSSLPSLLPPTQHLTLQTLSPGAINPYKATHGYKKRERERLLDEMDSYADADGDSRNSRAPRNGRFRAAVESANAAAAASTTSYQEGDTNIINSSSSRMNDGTTSRPFPFRDYTVIPIISPRWVALPRTHLMSNANWNTSPTMMAQEMKYGLFQLCNPYA